MGFGFPLRVSRLAFGPKLENTKQVRDPRKQIDGATIGNLLMWRHAQTLDEAIALLQERRG